MACIGSPIKESIRNLRELLLKLPSKLEVSEKCIKKKNLTYEPEVNINKRQLNANGICAGAK